MCVHHTSHWLLRPLSCSLDQMLWILPACSAWRLLSPQIHWCFCIWPSYAKPRCTHMETHHLTILSLFNNVVIPSSYLVIKLHPQVVGMLLLMLLINCHSPVVKRSWVSVAGLDNDMEGMVVGWCEAGGREVEAGEDRDRLTGWWGQIKDGTPIGSICRLGLRITCLCKNSGWKKEQIIDKNM